MQLNSELGHGAIRHPSQRHECGFVSSVIGMLSDHHTAGPLVLLLLPSLQALAACCYAAAAAAEATIGE